MVKRKPYSGSCRKLVLAFDVGTTFSGASYCVLDPGEEPKIKNIVKFPYQDPTNGSTKVPSIIWYNAEGKVEAIGAQAVLDATIKKAEVQQWSKVEWFKLLLRPKGLGGDGVDAFIQSIPPLPACKTIVEVLADYLRFLFQSAKAYIEKSRPNKEVWWNSVKSRIEFVLTHPNGWEGKQQSQMREAAVIAELVPDEQAGEERIHFVTEGEAGLHYCIGEDLLTEAVKGGDGIMVVDAGGGTIDVSCYKATGPESFEEVSASQCKVQGSLFVTQRARFHLEVYLQNSKFVRHVPCMVKKFDERTKHNFRAIDDLCVIQFGGTSDKDERHNIDSGQIILQGNVVASFFQPSIECITRIIEAQKDRIRTVFLVGGFAASEWLDEQVKKYAEEVGIDVCVPDSVNEAIANGAVSFFIDHFVSARVSKFQYGTVVNTLYLPYKSSHFQRRDKRCIDLSGKIRLPHAFDVILPKDTRVTEEQEFQEKYNCQARTIDSLENIQTRVLRYRGMRDTIEWISEDIDNFEVMCRIEADTSIATQGLLPRRRSDGQTYYALDFKIALLFGLTEFKAQICWTENGEEKRGPARVIYSTE
ncbi:hypothetical protein BDN72DRAFT_846729 [Pluteus cervinus]|uniref:Uncharacterized protein n=1 Tax=Pluteus cervinus TaxID=181527 RepID=A0ACD3AF61_9AGAR|nr:hypothetical protein BDN72DRAFT_846729 [Pluteus cervinus]